MSALKLLLHVCAWALINALNAEVPQAAIDRSPIRVSYKSLLIAHITQFTLCSPLFLKAALCGQAQTLMCSARSQQTQELITQR